VPSGPEAHLVHVALPFSRNRLLQALLACYAVVWLALGVAPADRQTWVLENLLVVAVALLLVLTHRHFVFSNLSYLLVTAFLLLHAVGAHSTYSAAAPGAWLEGLLGLARNPYDRIVHFCFGLLLGYPLRELARRVLHVRGFAAYAIPIVVLLALSSLYEILEGWTARIVDPAQGTAFVGAQGDEWDAQKDMALALTGAAVSMLATALYRRRSGREPWGILALLVLILLAPLHADASS
jgi:putative membrane protein